MIRKLNYPILSLILFILFNIIISAKVGAVAPTITHPPAGGLTLTPEPTVAEEDIRKSLIERLKKAAEQKSDEVGSILGAKAKAAVLGTLIDIANDTLTIDTGDSSEGMVATDDATTYVRNSKTAKAEDMQIGEFVIAMGYKNDKDILEAKRIVAGNTPPLAPDRSVILGTIGEIDSKNRTFGLTEGSNKYEVTVAKKISLDWDKLKDGNRIVIIASKGENGNKPLLLKAYKTISF